MHVELPRKELAVLAKAAAMIAKTSDTRPVLRNVLLTTTANGFELTATNLVVGFWLKIDKTDGAVVHEEGSALVNSQSFQRVIDTLGSDTVSLKYEDHQLRVDAGQARFKLVTEDARDFPGIGRFSKRKPFATIKSSTFTSMINRTAFCAHTERSHYNMHGVFLKCDKSQLEIAATNGQRLSVASTKVDPSDVTMTEEIVVPAAMVAMLKKVAGSEKDAALDLQWKARSLAVRGSRGEATLLALSGKFPPYQRGIPSNTKHVSLNRRLVIEILKQATALRTSTTAFVDLTLSDGKLTFQSDVQDSGSTKVELAGAWSDDELTLVVNPDFLLQSATAMDGTDVRLEVEDVNIPTLLRETDNESVESFCVFAVARK